MRVIRWLAALVALLLVAIGALFVVARFSDGPIAILPGGPLVAGEMVRAPVPDWSFASAEQEIELQLEGEGTSRTVWVLVHERQAYVPCSLSFPPGKSWHLRADQRGDAIVRISGRRYPVRLERVETPPLEAALAGIVSAKYGGAPGGAGGAWFFALRPR